MSITVKNINKSFHSNWGKVNALHEISFSCNHGEFVSIVGASGCGKTTLLRIIAGLEKPDSGEVYFDGQKVQRPGSDRAVVFQEPRLFPWLTVEKNASFGVQGIKSREEAEKNTTDALEMVGLINFRKAYPYELSGGMAQRVAIARALAVEPEVMLLDEPFSALDTQTRSKMQQELIDLWQKTGKTIILVTHDIEEALILSQKIMIMSPSPGTIKEVLEIPFPYPRKQDTEDFMEMRKYIQKNILINK